MVPKYRSGQKVKVVDTSSPHRGQMGIVEWLAFQTGHYVYGVRCSVGGQVTRFREEQLRAVA